MNQLKLADFSKALRAQQAGVAAAIDEIACLNVTLDDGYCFFNLYEQWAGAFSYYPGRLEALAPILSIAEEILRFSNDDTLAMYRLPEWRQLVDLRGPVETVQIMKCNDCSSNYPVMGTSGFLDIIDLVCPGCGSVFFRSYYDEEPMPPCACGSNFPSPKMRGCPRCGATSSQVDSEQSPFKYFSSHTFVRGAGA